jgi:hypothetical protein
MDLSSSYIEEGLTNFTSKYSFNIDKHAFCQMNRKGKIVLHRRLVNEVFGINFPKIQMEVIELIEEENQLKNLILVPTLKNDSDNIVVVRFKAGAILILNSLFGKLALNYKIKQYSFFCEPITLGSKSKAIRLTLTNVTPWPEYERWKLTERSQLDSSKNSPPPYRDSSNVFEASTSESLDNYYNKDQELLKDLLNTFLIWKVSHQQETDIFEFEKKFASLCLQLNQILFQIALPNKLQ